MFVCQVDKKDFSCVGQLGVNLTQARIIWEEGTSLEKMPTADEPVGICLYGIFLIANW